MPPIGDHLLQLPYQPRLMRGFLLLAPIGSVEVAETVFAVAHLTAHDADKA